MIKMLGVVVLLLSCCFWTTTTFTFHHIPKTQPSTTFLELSASKNNNDDYASLDSIRRRQLIWSSFIASGSAVFLPPPQEAIAAAAANDDDDEKETQKPFRKLTTADILLPPLDNRQYLYTQLEDNDLRILLVSDPESPEVACCMNVHVGATSDAQYNIQGLAHFQEHMLFLGTADYPEEDSFERFLSLNGGSSNAYTDAEDTVYYFTMESASKFSEGLKRFGSFFTNPLFTEAATGRELNAINSEHAKNIQSDSFRVYQLNKGRANGRHPFSRFFTGNYETLRDRVSTADLRQTLIQFHQDHYSSNQMSLAVVGPQSISQLEQMTRQAFSKVPNRLSTTPELQWKSERVYDAAAPSLLPSFGSIVEMIPVQPLRQLTLSFPICYGQQDERQQALYNKQADYITHLLGHEGPNSLLSYLKYQKDWAQSLGTASDNELSDLTTLDISIELTKDGLQHVDEILELVFGTLQLYRDQPMPNYVLTECVQLTDLEWRFATKGGASNYVQSLATNVEKYGAQCQHPEWIVAGPRRLAISEQLTSAPRNGGTQIMTQSQLQETQKLIQDLLRNYLTVDNALLTVMSPDLLKSGGGKFQKEKWYGTQYRVKSIPSATLQKWKTARAPPEIQYPTPNLFLPTEQGLKVKLPPKKNLSKAQKQSMSSKPPSIIRKDDRWTVHFKPDDRYGQPKAFCVVELYNSGQFYQDARTAALGMLYVTSVLDRLEESVYDARLVGLTYDLQLLPKGLRLSFGGYNEQLPQYIVEVIAQLKSGNLLPSTDQELDRYMDSLKRGLEGFDTKQPYAHASYYAYLTLQPMGFQIPNDEIRQASAKLTLQDLKSFSVWDRTDYIRGEALIQGNWNQAEALQLMKDMDDALRPLSFSSSSSSGASIPKFQALALPSSREYTQMTVQEPNPSNTNAAVHVLLQCTDRSRKSQVMMEILSNILSEPFYNQLRSNNWVTLSVPVYVPWKKPVHSALSSSPRRRPFHK